MQRFFRSSIGVNLGLTLGRLLPPKLGYQLSALGAKYMAQRNDSPMVKAVRANQFVIRGGTSTSVELDKAVVQVFTHAGRCFVDLYHNLQNPEGLKALCPLTDDLQRLIDWSQDKSFGAFVVAPHLSNFDLVLLAAAYHGLKGQVLTYGSPTGGYKIQNDIRAQTGLNITPVNPAVHTQAIENMRQGGFVITAVDRPIRRKAHYLTFFDRPSPLPAGHIRMALEADVPIIVAAAEMKPDGLYQINISAPIPLIHHEDPDEEIRFNGEVVLQEIESHIRRNPAQWLMYYPAWPGGIRNGEFEVENGE
jgi:KDO2-lipid IV(A) lauroyltransferase